jgi:hypothetical protein
VKGSLRRYACVAWSFAGLWCEGLASSRLTCGQGPTVDKDRCPHIISWIGSDAVSAQGLQIHRMPTEQGFVLGALVRQDWSGVSILRSWAGLGSGAGHGCGLRLQRGRMGQERSHCRFLQWDFDSYAREVKRQRRWTEARLTVMRQSLNGCLVARSHRENKQHSKSRCRRLPPKRRRTEVSTRRCSFLGYDLIAYSTKDVYP